MSQRRMLVQTDACVIDLARVVYINILDSRAVRVQLNNGTHISLIRDDAERFLENVVAQLSRESAGSITRPGRPAGELVSR